MPDTPLKRHIPICRALAQLMPGLVEVVLHDLNSGKIVHIENGFSPRKAGDLSLVDTENYESEMAPDGTIGPYRKANPDGSTLKSVSALLRDERNKPAGLLCINMKTDGLEAAAHALAGLAAVEPDRNQGFLKNDWRELANTVIAETLRRRNLGPGQAKRPDRLEIVRNLLDADVFAARGSADYVAEALGISRASLYGLLNEAKRAQRWVMNESETV